MRTECEYIYHGTLGEKNTCTLSGRPCLCVEEWQHCTRREYAQEYEQKHPKTAAARVSAWRKGMGRGGPDDGTGHVRDTI